MSLFLTVTECAILHRNKYLLITRPKGVHAAGLLSFPGGKVDYADGDNQQDILRTAIKREVYEEVGLQIIEPLHFITSSFFTDSVTQSKVLDVIFLCVLEKTIPKIIPSSREVAAFHWLTFEEIKKHALASPWLKEYASKVEAFLDNAHL